MSLGQVVYTVTKLDVSEYEMTEMSWGPNFDRIHATQKPLLQRPRTTVDAGQQYLEKMLRCYYAMALC